MTIDKATTTGLRAKYGEREISEGISDAKQVQLERVLWRKLNHVKIERNIEY